jgi:predicted transposase/invertase (TIGR01784 family)
MKTDELFYRLFESCPETLFLLLGLSPQAAQEAAARYQYLAVEFKETAHRTDGVFLPREAGLPIYFLEVQFYRLSSVFADLMVKAFTYLKKNIPGQLFYGVVLFASRALEPKELVPYQPFLDANRIHRFYLDELKATPTTPLGLAIMQLVQQPDFEAPTAARTLVTRLKTEIEDEARKDDLIELASELILAKLPLLTREEVMNMLQLHDPRESRFAKEMKEEGREEGRVEGVEEGLAVAARRLAKQNLDPIQIATLLELTEEQVCKALGGVENK